jgi:hypothetical protein
VTPREETWAKKLTRGNIDRQHLCTAQEAAWARAAGINAPTVMTLPREGWKRIPRSTMPLKYLAVARVYGPVWEGFYRVLAQPWMVDACVTVVLCGGGQKGIRAVLFGVLPEGLLFTNRRAPALQE